MLWYGKLNKIFCKKNIIWNKFIVNNKIAGDEVGNINIFLQTILWKKNKAVSDSENQPWKSINE